MSMEITNNYSNYAANYADTTKKSSSNGAAEVKTNTSTNSKNKVQEYYEKLCKKFPQINFNTNGGVLASNSSKVTVNLSYDCLKKMSNDPEFAKEIEWNLSGEATANSMVYGWAKRDGVVLGGRTVTYDANGNRQSSCGGMRTVNAGNGNSNTNKLQKKYKTEEERWLKARKKLEEKEKIDKKRAEKKAAEEMAIFKKEFYAEIDKIPRDRTIANVAINISEEAFKNMKGDPEYMEKVLSLIRRDMTGSVAPAPDCSLVITVGATSKDYRADGWSVNNDSEFYARSQNSFYKKTSDKKDSQKELLEEYLEKRAQVKKQQQEMLNEKVAKQEQERSRLLQSWNNEKLLAKASNAYEANIMTEVVTDSVFPLG